MILIDYLEYKEKIGDAEMARFLDELFDDSAKKFLSTSTRVPKEVIEENLHRQKCFIVFDEKPIGFAYIYDCQEYEKGCLAYGVLPSERGKGWCQKIIEALIEECKKLGISRIALEIEPDNTSSLNVLKKISYLGFEYEGCLRNNYGKGCDSEIYALIL